MDHAIPSCSVDGCEKPIRSSGAELCAMHYHRKYRHGDVNRVSARSGISVSLGRRYRHAYVPVGHPFRQYIKGESAYAHRLVLFDKIGPGEHACHWCSRPISWAAAKVAPDALQVDHLNGIGDDNRADNLVPSCRGCNIGRAAQARSDELRRHGWWSVNDTISQLSAPSRRERIA